MTQEFEIERFKALADQLPPLLDALLASDAQPMDAGWTDFSTKGGVYLFTDGSSKEYVGRTENLRQRLQFHVRNNPNQANLAVKMARKECDLPADYTIERSPRWLLEYDPVFERAFDNARQRIRMYQVQFVACEKNQTVQALFEIYAATVLDTRWNDFPTS